jgi:erythromycin esterase
MLYDNLTNGLRRIAGPLSKTADLDPLIRAVGDARFVLLGEASHGTSEFYTWRAEISKRLIRERGFSFIAVEGDWPDCYRVDAYVKGREGSEQSAEATLHAFARWPTWLWANREMVDLCEWLREHNDGPGRSRPVGFYGLDVYSLWESLHAVMRFLEAKSPDLAWTARRAYACFEPYGEDAQRYASATAFVPASCEEEVVEMLRALTASAGRLRADGREAFFDAEQNAIVVRNAERYYRAMMRGGPESWNIRDIHMVQTLGHLRHHHGEGSKAIIWEHNTHIGDARFTDMRHAGMVNVGQLVREAHRPEGVVLVGFGTHRGTVIAAEEWGAPMERMRVPHARPDAFESAMHDAAAGDALLVFDGTHDAGVPGFDEPLDHRAIGVVYDPERERWGNYVPTIVPRRYDAFVYIDETRAVDPLHMPVRVDGEPVETYPTGM